MQFLYTFSHIGANNIYTVQFWYIQYHLQPCVSQTNIQSENNYFLRFFFFFGVSETTNPID